MDLEISETKYINLTDDKIPEREISQNLESEFAEGNRNEIQTGGS